MCRFLASIFLISSLIGAVDQSRVAIDWQKVRNLTQSPPEWMMRTAENALDQVKHLALSSQALDLVKALGGFSCLCRCTVKQKTLAIKLLNRPRIHTMETYQLQVIKTVLQLLVDHTLLTNDVDFIIDLWDISPGSSVPIFTFSKDRSNARTVLFPDHQSFAFLLDGTISDVEKNMHTWETKKSILFWRGSPHDLWSWSGSVWEAPRVKLAALAQQHRNIDAKFTYYQEMDKRYQTVRSRFGTASSIKPADQTAYRYLLAMDGVTAPFSGNLWPLFSGSVLLKQESDKVQWYYHMLKPYEHYVPVKRDLSNLVHVLDWLHEHDAQAKVIAQNAKAFAQANLTLEHHLAYAALLINRYSELQKKAL